MSKLETYISIDKTFIRLSMSTRKLLYLSFSHGQNDIAKWISLEFNDVFHYPFK